ncbi:MBL fold metallo-hydrolase [Legionella bononiensis]|uniref:MBL fold metallo-hydrolase n=1 Tax=Legionella bononiensis TaxID=2793102 RepID=A0ABS1WFW7_9GAMM|nr:MBL fold metallo-hydrolase [Legionella bononiensis]MBL7481709.1 MBL fold metallo-hydrolase [Legionella bononiensis]MBL7528257.1 MBL fold metallo-hydrolase [Legionella bononiensis]
MSVSRVEQRAIEQLNFLISHSGSSIDFIECSSEAQLSINWFFKSRTSHKLKDLLQNLINSVAQDLQTVPSERHYSPHLPIVLLKFIHLNPNGLIEQLNLTIPDLLKRKELTFAKRYQTDKENSLRQHNHLVSIDFDPRTGLYTSPDDHLAHQHGTEALRIFISTQWERFKGFIHRLLANIGIYVFENAPYEEHDYIHTDIYANDFAVDPFQPEEASYFFDGHATNLIAIPTEHNALTVLTDPVEGDLNPLFYPRMTHVANPVNNQDERMLPKVDVIIISHNHRDHVDTQTLKRLVNQQPLMVIPEGDFALFNRLGFKRIVELKWWEQATIKEKNQEILRITAVPTRHWSGRGLTDAHRSAFNGYVLQAPSMSSDIYFAGDTALMDDEISAPIFELFNVQTSIQPGGPDEVREDMQSTHQSSADTLLMHFKMLLAWYKKQNTQDLKPDLEQFLESSKAFKTIYNHTSTFKLGNLRLRDTFYSVNRIIAAFGEEEHLQKSHLTPYEYEVFTNIKTIVGTMVFSNGETLSNENLRDMILHSVVIPKIGQRLTLSSELKQDVSKRNLILNKRALVELDHITQDLVAKSMATKEKQLNLRLFLITALDHYNKPWYAFFSRSFRSLSPYLNELKSSEVDVKALVQRMEHDMQPLNRFGHMQSIIHYTKWLLDINKEATPSDYLDNFFTCQQVRKTINQEINSTGSWPLISDDRTPKQKAFKILANQLAQTPETKTAYSETMHQWHKQLVDESGSHLLSAHRLFATQKTHSQCVVEDSLVALREGENKVFNC